MAKISEKMHFHLHYNKGSGHFVYGEPNLLVICDELELCGYTDDIFDAVEAFSVTFLQSSHSDQAGISTRRGYSGRSKYRKLEVAVLDGHIKSKRQTMEVRR